MGKFKISSAGLNNSNNQNESMLLPVPRQSFWQTSTNQTPQHCQEQASNATWVLPHFPHPLNKWKNSSYHVTISYWLSESLTGQTETSHGRCCPTHTIAVMTGHMECPSSPMSWTHQNFHTTAANKRCLGKEHRYGACIEWFIFSLSPFPLQTPMSQVLRWATKPPSHLISFSGF